MVGVTCMGETRQWMLTLLVEPSNMQQQGHSKISLGIAWGSVGQLIGKSPTSVGCHAQAVQSAVKSRHASRRRQAGRAGI